MNNFIKKLKSMSAGRKGLFAVVSLMALAAIVDYMFLGGSLLPGLALAAVAPAVPTVTPAESANGKPATPESAGVAGIDSQQGGQAATVSNVEDAAPELLEEEIDKELLMIKTDEAVMDTIKRSVKRQVKITNGMEVAHFMVDEKKAYITVLNQTTIEQKATPTKVVLSDGDKNMIMPYYTASCNCVDKGASGSDSPGIKTNVTLFCTSVSEEGDPTFRVIGGVDGHKYQIAAGERLLLMASACYETQKRIAPSTFNPVKESMFLQKQLASMIVSDYFAARRKKIAFGEAQQAQAMIRNFRIESARTAWYGHKGKIKVKALDPALGEQYDYFSEGLKWQFKRSYKLPNGGITYPDLINLSLYCFTGYDTNNEALLLCGKNLLANIQAMDFSKYKEVEILKGEVLGLKVTSIRTLFGTFHLAHDKQLDRGGDSKNGAVLNISNLVRYYNHDEKSIKEDVEGEEAKRSTVITIDCLCLKGYGHVWIDGSGTSRTNEKLGMITTVTNNHLPDEYKAGDIIITTEPITDLGLNLEAAKMYKYDGSTWKEFTGE